MTADVIAMLPKGRTFRSPKGARQPLKLFPKGGGKQQYWLYAVGFTGGVVKIGRTAQPRHRLGTHWTNAKGAVEWVHLFGSGSRHWAYVAESQACELAGAIGLRVRKSEWFNGGLTRADAIKVGRAASVYAAATVEECAIRSEMYRQEQEIFGEAREAAAAQIAALRAKAA